ncbi:MAG: hypothetical protein ACD_22C00166G0010 [uncultured bacterium]|nr:MAG: hypothetical protein ACD_22C00166G0010 [uncultured bacterium]
MITCIYRFFNKPAFLPSIFHPIVLIWTGLAYNGSIKSNHGHHKANQKETDMIDYIFKSWFFWLWDFIPLVRKGDIRGPRYGLFLALSITAVIVGTSIIWPILFLLGNPWVAISVAVLAHLAASFAHRGQDIGHWPGILATSIGQVCWVMETGIVASLLGRVFLQ